MNKLFFRNEMYRMLETNCTTYDDTQIAYFWIDDVVNNDDAYEGYTQGLIDFCKDKFNK